MLTIVTRGTISETDESDRYQILSSMLKLAYELKTLLTFTNCYYLYIPSICTVDRL